MPDEDMGWDEIGTGGFEPLPVGPQPVRVIALDPTIGKEKGTAYRRGQFEVIEGEYEGRYLFSNLMVDANLAPGAMGRTKSLVVASGIEFPKGLSLEEAVKTLNEAREDLLGTECIAVVGQRTYEGEITNEVKRFMSLK